MPQNIESYITLHFLFIQQFHGKNIKYNKQVYHLFLNAIYIIHKE